MNSCATTVLYGPNFFSDSVAIYALSVVLTVGNDELDCGAHLSINCEITQTLLLHLRHN